MTMTYQEQQMLQEAMGRAAILDLCARHNRAYSDGDRNRWLATFRHSGATYTRDGEVFKDLRSAFDAAVADEAVRVLVLTGAGRAFSTGADLADSANTPIKDGRPDLEQVLHDRYHHLIRDFRSCPKPLVAAVNGPCAGVGMSFALACDLVVAARSAYFLQAFVNIGLVPDGGASALMAARIGFTRAMELGALETIGVTKVRLAGLLLTESLLLAVLGGVLGTGVVLLGFHLYPTTLGVEGFGIDFLATPSVAIAGLVASLAVGVLAAIGPAAEAVLQESSSSLGPKLVSTKILRPVCSETKS